MVPVSNRSYQGYLIFVKSHIYKLIACLLLLLIFMQYLADFMITTQRLIQSSASISSLSSTIKWPLVMSAINHNNSIFNPTLKDRRLSSTLNEQHQLQQQQLLLQQHSQIQNSIQRLNSNFKLPPSPSSSSSSNVNVNASASESTFSSNKFDLPVTNNYLTNASQLELCPLIPPKLVGRLKVMTEILDWAHLEEQFPDIETGGCFRPKNCIARQKVAIIVPYRDRELHLRILIHNLHPMLQRQQIDYCIYIIEQMKDTMFNRAKLFNIGFMEASKQKDYDCFIFHDVDLVPEDDRNLYRCAEQPRHMSVAINTMKYKLPYNGIFGGVSALSKKQMIALNGFSNEYWGWGGEDDDMSHRISYHGFRITRYPETIARYSMLRHPKETPNPDSLLFPILGVSFCYGFLQGFKLILATTIMIITVNESQL
ncbi:beta-1,4-N-acetylgalactosaminyltransferase bre-4 isoform X2 [Tetranychus urticae]|uniref:beta-1,4-N-acetylgalactosaminyltransferase bre-4 isoform X2 n=1 Tax=Tetranychus urticae TaxID=32264 RepID=UPI000D643BA9|nr:beta-1,4-N-acetylgalactosaminyltransferase bre-4 isoform X2 [Tetranychus urticae]